MQERLDVLLCVCTCICVISKEQVFLINNIPFLVHPCDEAYNGGCSQVCNKKNEKHECSCEAGFVIGEDGKSCKKG